MTRMRQRKARTVRISREELGTIVDESMPSGSLKANPLEVTREHLERILEELTGAAA